MSILYAVKKLQIIFKNLQFCNKLNRNYKEIIKNCKPFCVFLTIVKIEKHLQKLYE